MPSLPLLCNMSSRLGVNAQNFTKNLIPVFKRTSHWVVEVIPGLRRAIGIRESLLRLVREVDIGGENLMHCLLQDICFVTLWRIFGTSSVCILYCVRINL